MESATLLTAVELTGWELLQAEIIKAIPTTIVAAIGAVLAFVVGKRVAAYWALRQKRREIELVTLNEFYRLYGEFFAVWKLWNQYLKKDELLPTDKISEWTLLDRACTAEALMEAIFVKIASERVLTDEQVADLGLFRQAFQSLRKQMQKNRKLDWGYDEHAQYAAMKRLACSFSTMFLSSAKYCEPSTEIAQLQLKTITCNDNEVRWDKLAEDKAQ